ncbi:uncharacterized protein CANTADRAFT_5904 [Suhomyces tanzawaensis NRRL Y-17324]|uniref:MICOS complex subunit MIC12 n=1 Tax=Suhomyces tanzawaensis NRRL Y-17324 TaxID=984487 RepID=A0A1E4SL84_9ASCO|nr:uncharacterized protein CANTADRAFT_5904 [Suhomyces tanzawaensis NRRL Y-17324]ODV80248.1 hypothetical protein CANTADRAFT_5904 [Suhomyces tanzawaensis NRRL Y-17324]
MGGRIHGFLGGVLLTSALTYYTGEYFKKNQQFISHQLRVSDNTINNRILSDHDLKKELIPIDKRIGATTRVNFSETCKDIWNDEIIKMVNWVYGINWYQWGLTADKKLLSISDKIANSITEKK